MKVNGTLMNYYFHCKRQCYLHGNRMNLEDNSENVQIGKAIHEEKAAGSSNSEIAIENIKLDKLTAEYLTEIKKSDADEEAAKWQLYYYLYVLKTKGIVRKGRLQFVEKNKKDSKYHNEDKFVGSKVYDETTIKKAKDIYDKLIDNLK